MNEKFKLLKGSLVAAGLLSSLAFVTAVNAAEVTVGPKPITSKHYVDGVEVDVDFNPERMPAIYNSLSASGSLFDGIKSMFSFMRTKKHTVSGIYLQLEELSDFSEYDEYLDEETSSWLDNIEIEFNIGTSFSHEIAALSSFTPTPGANDKDAATLINKNPIETGFGSAMFAGVSFSITEALTVSAGLSAGLGLGSLSASFVAVMDTAAKAATGDAQGTVEPNYVLNALAIPAGGATTGLSAQNYMVAAAGTVEYSLDRFAVWTDVLVGVSLWQTTRSKDLTGAEKPITALGIGAIASINLGTELSIGLDMIAEGLEGYVGLTAAYMLNHMAPFTEAVEEGESLENKASLVSNFMDHRLHINSMIGVRKQFETEVGTIAIDGGITGGYDMNGFADVTVEFKHDQGTVATAAVDEVPASEGVDFVPAIPELTEDAAKADDITDTLTINKTWLPHIGGLLSVSYVRDEITLNFGYQVKMSFGGAVAHSMSVNFTYLF